ncbi:hypothetical protein [Nonomuraea jabiensis]|uniref:Excreted virulence factor EspC, type VII ESX diderm n=1 Tax=Nonomuraea jabiensis TaxID=882448 RepID=A0A7W9G7X7_9ACTN|nr:hypothetical protein [Nonomuraea jabiensis]MBB5778875.1 hypothetical protein [Nonomuraea jabiensis]
MSGDFVATQAGSIREMGRNIAAAPMRDLERMSSAIRHVNLSAGAYGAFGLLGGSLEQAFDDVKRAALTYLAAKRAEVSGIHDKAYGTANTYVDGDANAGRTAADITRT